MEYKKINRQSNFELLRILAMFFIVVHHYMVHGVQHVLSSDMIARSSWLLGSNINRIFTIIFEPAGAIGVGLFFMLSGYFMYGKECNLNKIKKLLIQLFFYSFLFLGIYLVIKKLDIYSFPEFGNGISLIFRFLFPIGQTTWWFFTVWILLYLMASSFNTIFENMNEKKYIVFLFSFLIFFVFIGSVKWEPYESIQRGIFYFLMGRYVKQFNRKFNIFKCSICLSISFICCFLFQFFLLKLFLKYGVEYVINHKIDTIINGITDGLLTPFCVFSIFCIFINLKIKNSNIINKISATTFGIYILHANPFGEEILWKLMNVESWYKTKIFPLYAISSCILLFFICSFIDYCRIKLFSLFRKREYK